jgi:hypothetical protein
MTQPAAIPTNGMSYIDFMMNSMIMEQMKVVSNGNGFSIQVILSLIIILSMTELKPLVGQYVKIIGETIVGFLKVWLVYMYEYISSVFTVISIFLRFGKNEIAQSDKIEESKQMYVIEWKPSIQTGLQFFNYLFCDFDFDKCYETLTYEKNENSKLDGLNYNVQYRNIKFTFDNDNYFLSDIDFSFQENKLTNFSCGNCEETIKFGSMKFPICLADLITDNDVSKTLKTYLNNGFKRYPYTDTDFVIFTDDCGKLYSRELLTNDDKIWNELKIAYLATIMYPTLKYEYVINELIILASGIIKKKNGEFWNINPYKEFEKFRYNGLRIFELGINIDINQKQFYYDKFNTAENIIFHDKLRTVPTYLLSTNESPAQTIFVKIVSDKKIDYYAKFQKFLNTISDSEKGTGIIGEKKKINIYELKLSLSQKEKTIDNPKYKEYLETIKEIQGLSGEKKEKNEATLASSYIETSGTPPPKTITTSEEIALIDQTSVNSVYKGFDTLYLRKNDKMYLKSILERFSSCSDIYSNLDIPHKLGILLYGEPGTGKSSTIKTIASYTKRDIYYVDLSNITKNSELKLIFDHVIKGCKKGGILVFEDIDAMTDIVKPRQPDKSDEEYDHLTNDQTQNMSNVIKSKNDKLTLSYFLNLLDGTLCSDNMLFIMTTNHVKHLDPALIRNGRVDITIELKACDHYQISCIYETILKKNIDEQVLKRIPEFKYKPIDIITHVIKYYVCNMSTDNIMDDFMQ